MNKPPDNPFESEPPGAAAAGDPSSENAKTAFEAIMFTDIEGSVGLEQELGTKRYAALLVRHGELFREALSGVTTRHTEKHTGDGFMARFSSPSDAVAAALHFQWLLRREEWPCLQPLRVRIGIHEGEIMVIDSQHEMPSAVGAPVNLASRVQALAAPGQVLLTRGVFDSGRQFIKMIPHVPVEEQAELNWQAHGAYLIKGLETPVEIFEVGEHGLAPFVAPASGSNALRSVSAEEEATLGWRPAKGLEVPRRAGWRLQEGLGEGGFGEVWLAENVHTSQRRVFKFCFDVTRLRSFKRELLLFRLIRERLGPRRDIALLFEVQLEAPPFFLESEYCPGGTLKQWFEAKCTNGDVPMTQRLEIVARVARALAAAHSVGIIHKDLKPSNIFIEEREGAVWPKLADFGIGVLIDRTAAEGLTGVTAASEPSPTGSQLYTPPEYLANQPASIQGDVYSLGVVLYQMVIGDFARPVGPGWHRDIPDALLAEDIATCVDWDPQRRFSSALQVAERLETLEQRRAECAAIEATERRLAEQQREVAAQRRRLRLALGVGVATLVLMAALIALAVVLNRERKGAVEHGKQLQAQTERAEDMYYIADMQTATEDMAQRRGEMIREIIERHRPWPGKRDQRGWEWFFVDSVLNTPAWVRNVSPSALRALAVSADETHIALAGDEGVVSIWQRDTLEKVRTFTVGEIVRALSWHRSGVLAAALANGEIALIASPLSGGEMRRWQAHRGGVTTLQWHPKGDELASGGADGTLAWWSESGELLGRIERAAPILALAWRPGGAEMAALFGQPVQLVVATPETMASKQATALNIEESPLAWHPSGAEISIATQDRPMRSWNPWTNEFSVGVTGVFSAGSTAFAWSPRDNGLAIGGVDGKILLIDANRPAEARTPLYGHRGRVNALCWIGKDEERLLSVGDDGSLRVWSDLWQSPEVRAIKFDQDLADAQWHPKENKLAALVSGDEVQVLRGDTGDALAAWRLPPPYNPRAPYRGGRVLWSPAGDRLAVVCAGRPLAIWNAGSGAIHVVATSGEENDAQWMPDGDRLLVRRDDGWSLLALGENASRPLPETASAVWVGGLGGDAIAVVANSESGARVRRQNLDGTPVLDVAVPTELRKVRRCALNTDRTLLAVGGETGGVAWVDTRTGEWQRPAIQHAGPIRGLAWHPNGSRLVSAGADATCRFFATAQIAQTWLLAHQLRGDPVATGWSADGRRFMIACASQRFLRIYDASRSIDLQQRAEPKLMTTAGRLSEACAQIAAQPEDDAGWRALEQHLQVGAEKNPSEDAKLLHAAAVLGAQAQFNPRSPPDAPNSKLTTHFDGAELPAAVQVLEACVLRDWPAVLKLCAEAQPRAAAAPWFALAKAEALLQLNHRTEAEGANLAAWTARREQSGAIEPPMPPITGRVDDAPRHVDLRAWANMQLNEDWSGGKNNSLSSLPALVAQPDGYHFRCGEFLQLAGKTFRTSSGYMLPRETGWIPFGCEARRVVLMIAACYIEPKEHYAGLCIGSIFLQRSDGRGAVRIPLVFGENVWDWWVPCGGHVSQAPPAAIAWSGETPHSRDQGKTAALFRLVWQAEAGAPPVVAASLVSNLRRPAPFLLAITVGNAPPTSAATTPTSP